MRMVLTPNEAAEQLQMSVNEVLRMLAEGKIEAYKIGTRWKIPSEKLKSTIERWAQEESERRRGMYENREDDGSDSGGSDNRICGVL